MSLTKIDLKRELAPLYAPTAEPAMVDVPELSFLMVDGRGDPSTTPAYGHAVSALYSLAYGVRFALKRAGIDVTVMPLEGLWSAEDMSAFHDRRTVLRQPVEPPAAPPPHAPHPHDHRGASTTRLWKSG